MGTEKKSGIKAETHLANSLYKKFKRKCKKDKTSMAQVLRDLVQAFVKN